MIGFGDCESLFARLRNKKAIAEKYSARNFLGIQQSLGSNELDNVYWLPGTDSPADGLTEVESDMVPLLHVFKSGTFRPGILGPLRGISSMEGVSIQYSRASPPFFLLTAYLTNLHALVC